MVNEEVNNILLKEIIILDNFKNKIIDNPIEVKKYLIKDIYVYIDNDNIVYNLVPNILNLELGQKIGYIKNKVLFINKKLI